MLEQPAAWVWGHMMLNASDSETTGDLMKLVTPASFSQRILLVVTGLSPQVVTETLYALAVKPMGEQERFIPTEIHVISTELGAEHVRLNLFSGEPGWFNRMQKEFDLPAIKFDESTLHVLKDASGKPMLDIRSQADNESVADQIAGVVRELTADETSAVHVSLAGGRKTMGFFLGYALSLYGRPQDQLSHVLVTPPYESHPDFYYPSRIQRVIQTRDQNPRPLDCSKAEIELANIPFVRMRDGIDERLLAGKTSFSSCVNSAQRALQPPELILDLEHQLVLASGKQVKLPRAELALLAVFARRAIRADKPLSAPPKSVDDEDWAERYLTELRFIAGEMADIDSTERALAKGMSGEYFSSRLSRLRKNLKKSLGSAAAPYCIDDGGVRPRQYRLDLPARAVQFKSLTDHITI